MWVVVSSVVSCRFGRLSLLLLLVELLDRLNLLLELHPPVLEPDLDLSLGETELVSHLYSSSSREVMVGVKLLLQLEGLIAGVRLTASAAEAGSPREKVSPT